MKYCSRCGVFVAPFHEACPLCGYKAEEAATTTEGNQPFDDGLASALQYPSYYRDHSEQKVFTIKRFLFFLTVSACIISVFINIFTADEILFLWSIIVTVALFAAWGAYKSLCSKTMPTGLKMLVLYGVLSAVSVTIDACTGFDKWSTTYVIPFLTVALTLLFTIVASSKKKRFSEYLGYLITTFFISICPVLLFVFSLSTKGWTSMVALLSCIIASIGMFIFSDDIFKEELKKRFHF